VLDYSYVVGRPIFGGELSFKTNFVSLTREMADFDQIRFSGACSANPALNKNCFLLRGMPGDYDRLSTQATWRTSVTDSFGQVWTPFASLRGDVAAMSIKNQAISTTPGSKTVADYLTTGGSDLARGMPTVGLEYRYPFINVHSWGTQTIEPI